MGQPMVRVVAEDAMATHVRIIKQEAINKEIADYKGQNGEGWKSEAAQAFFDNNSIEAPASLVQRLEWAQRTLAMAEGALVDWMLQHELSYNRAIGFVSKYQAEREAAMAK